MPGLSPIEETRRRKVRFAPIDIDGVAIAVHHWPLEPRSKLQKFVRIHDEDVVCLTAGKVETFRAVVAEALPGSLVQLARNILENIPDKLLRAIRRTRVANHQVVDKWPYRIDATTQHLRLVLHDHGGANCGFAHGAAGKVASPPEAKISS